MIAVIDPSLVAIVKGGSQQFTVTLYLDGIPVAAAPEGTVWNWSVTGNQSAGTKVNANGLLTVSIGETTEQLEVHVVSQSNEALTDIATVIIGGNSSAGNIAIIDKAAINGSVTLDEKNWIVLKKSTLDRQKYALLISSSLMGTTQGGTRLQDYFKKSFTALGATIKSNAVVPTFGTTNMSDPYSCSEPTTIMALSAGVDTSNVMFALSHLEAQNWPMQFWGVNNGSAWWLRSVASNGQAYIASGAAPDGGRIGTASTSGTYYVRPAVWVKY
ncbi:MAG: hypothetical protein LBT44_01850 [Clostridiales bacterium]|jgi:hypothetical protein|nr:hypothetical protein [Clostridiales bacterium]